MKIFFTYQGTEKRYFFDLDVSSSLTVSELLEFKEIKNILTSIDH